MAIPITVAIIGASGNMGRAITKSLNHSPYRLLLICGNEQKLTQVLEEAGYDKKSEAENIDCMINACWEADLIIAAVPYEAEKQLSEKIKQVTTGKIVISISNPGKNTSGEDITDISAAEQLQQLLPYSQVIKAFNTVRPADFKTSFSDKTLFDVFVAGDDEESVRAVCELVKYSGFNPVKAGKLAESRNLENMMDIVL